MSVETNPHNYTNMNLIFSQFLPVRNSPKENSGASGGFLLKPLLLRLRQPNSKSFPQKIVLPKLRPHCSATCLNTWKAEPRKKNALSILEKITPAKIRKSKECFFFRGCWRTRQCVGLSPSVRFSFASPRTQSVRHHLFWK